MNFNKQKIYEIFLTALIGALIAFLQSLILPTEQLGILNDTTISAGVWGGAIRAFRHC
jgi:hypothetical protein